MTDAACPHCEVQITEMREAPKNLPRTFGIGTLMVVIAAVGVSFALIRAVPPLGIPIGMILALGLVRTYRGIAVSQAIDWPMTRSDRLALAAESMAVAFLLLGGGVIVFIAVLVPVGGVLVTLASTAGGVLSGAIALVPTAYVVRTMARNLWPVRFH
jgi:hypothetical protein